MTLLNGELRIKNRSLLHLLSVVGQLGNNNISSRIYIEACRARGISVTESFFLHYETLFDYGFLVVVNSTEYSQAKLIDETDVTNIRIHEGWDSQFSMTSQGQAFYDRFGGF